VTVQVADLLPGDVLAVRTTGRPAWLIRRRAPMLEHPWQPWKWFDDKPNLVNHVAMFTHLDQEGIPRGLEGRPGGFGWANLTAYAADPATVANTGQPKTAEQRAEVVRLATEAVGLPYDWAAILSMAAEAAGFEWRAAEWPPGGVPSQGVCSSALDYFYEAVLLANPGGYTQTRGTDPQAWADWIAVEGWAA